MKKPKIPAMGDTQLASLSLTSLYFLTSHLNFYRAHLLYFIFAPLIVSGIFYASNSDANPVSYIDSLFMSVSGMTVTGLNSALFENFTTWQQTILFLCQAFGSTATVSLLTVIIRLHFFRSKFKKIAAARSRQTHVTQGDIESNAYDKAAAPPTPPRQRYVRNRFGFLSSRTPSKTSSREASSLSSSSTPRRSLQNFKKKPHRLRPDMVRRTDEPVRVNKMNVGGWISEDPDSSEGGKVTASPDSSVTDENQLENIAESSNAHHPQTRTGSSPVASTQEIEGTPTSQDTRSPRAHEKHHMRRASWNVGPRSPTSPGLGVKRNQTHAPDIGRRNTTIEFQEPFQRSKRADSAEARRRAFSATNTERSGGRQRSTATRVSRYPTQHSTKHTGFGGFPNPVKLGAQYIKSRISPGMPRTVTLTSTRSIHPTEHQFQPTRNVPYISFDTSVGRNSAFNALTKEQYEELGGIEYRALNLLLKILVFYLFGVPFLIVIIVLSYLYGSGWKSVFEDSSINPAWFSFFNGISAFSNNGMRNTAFPVLLRVFIWCLSKAFRRESRIYEDLRFLLDHPRRCFLYLFPAYQTWFLAFVVACLTIIDWLAVLILNIGLDSYDNEPVGRRIADGFFQATCVRSSGFQVFQLSTTAPSVQVLYVIMMYIAVYPIALSIRSTNVYEEKSMGVFNDDESKSDTAKESQFNTQNNAGSYIAYHARKQLAFDIWWLAFALFTICIVERHHIMDPETWRWFNIFSVMFEISSGYGTVGLSLGAPSGTSLSGGFRTLSKLIMVVVMVRGRHRGLPIAIDRAVLLPSEIEFHDPTPLDESEHREQGEDDNVEAPLDEEQEWEGTVGRANYDQVVKAEEEEEEKENRSPESRPSKSPPGSPKESPTATRSGSNVAPGASVSFALPPQIPGRTEQSEIPEEAIDDDN